MDWKNTIAELQATGLTQEQIARSVGVGQSTVAALLSGSQKDMKWANGERLRVLHQRAIRRKHRAKLDSKEVSHA